MTATATPTIEEHLQNLCEAIAADEEVKAARANAETFLADEEAVNLYREVATTSHDLERRHRSGEIISDEEVGAYEDLQEKADSHPGIQSFQEAQQVLQRIANMVNKHVTKTLEKGRVPTADEMASSGGCGSGCGCHH